MLLGCVVFLFSSSSTPSCGTCYCQVFVFPIHFLVMLSAVIRLMKLCNFFFFFSIWSKVFFRLLLSARMISLFRPERQSQTELLQWRGGFGNLIKLVEQRVAAFHSRLFLLLLYLFFFFLKKRIKMIMPRH